MGMFDAQVGYSLDLETDERFAGGETPIGRGLIVPPPLLSDPMFEQALLNRAIWPWSPTCSAKAASSAA